VFSLYGEDYTILGRFAIPNIYLGQSIKKCDSCAVQKQLKMNKAPMGQFIVGEPMERVAMDVCGLILVERVFPIWKRLHNSWKICDSKFLPWSEYSCSGVPNLLTNSILNVFL
jgi:hypothetical protein